MSTNRGIFESFPNQPASQPDSPFAVAPEQTPEPVSSPFTAVARQESPFSVVDEAAEAHQVEPGKPAKLPERRKMESPFQVAEPSEGFGFEAPARPFGASPFEAVAPSSSAAPAPFASATTQPASSPFSSESQRAPSTTTQAAIAAFTNWQDAQSTPTAVSQQTPTPAQTPAYEPAAPPPFSAPAPQAQPAFAAPTTAPAPAATSQASVDNNFSDSFSIRQLELRAIFGVDREMNTDEILQRSRALPGMRNIARVAKQDMGTIEALKSLLPNLGFGTGSLKLYAGAVPLEFIREGPVLLAVQTDGGFAPGVRETLMLVARELGRTS